MNLFRGQQQPEPVRLSTNGAIDLQQQQEQSLKMFSNEFGIKFTRMNVDKAFVDSLGITTLNTTANSSAQSNNQTKHPI